MLCFIYVGHMEKHIAFNGDEKLQKLLAKGVFKNIM